MKVLYFTGTGNSLYVAKRLGGTCCSIPQLLHAGLRTLSDEAIGFVFPCYGFGVPKIVAEFVRQSRFRSDYFFAVMTYGNRAASGLFASLRRLLRLPPSLPATGAACKRRKKQGPLFEPACAAERNNQRELPTKMNKPIACRLRGLACFISLPACAGSGVKNFTRQQDFMKKTRIGRL